MTIEYKDSKRIVGLSVDPNTSLTPSVESDYTNSSWSTQVNTSGTYWQIANNSQEFQGRLVNSGSGSNYDLGTSFQNINQWTLRFEITVDSNKEVQFNGDCITMFGIQSGTTMAGTSGGSGGSYSSSRAQAQFQIATANSTRKFQGQFETGTSVGQDNSHFTMTYSNDTKYYIELKKTGSTSYTLSAGTNSDYATGRTSSNITGVSLSGLRYLHMETWNQNSSYESRNGGKIENLKIWTDNLKPTDVQDNSIFLEKDTAKIYWRTPALAPTVSDDLTTDKGWISTVTGNGYNATYDRVDFKISCPPDTSSFAGGRFLIDLQDSDYLDGSNLATNFIIRFPWKLTDSTLVSSGSETRSYLGLFSSDAWGGTSQDYFGVQLFVSSTTRYALRVECIDGGTFQGGTETRTDTTLIPVVDTQYYFELKKVGDVHSFTVTTNSDYTGGQTVNVTKTGITGLRYFGIKSRGDSQPANGNIEGYVSPDIEVYNGVTSVTPATWTYGSGIVATGGVEETVGGYTYRKFASSGTFAVTAGSGNLEVLIVGAGGAGGGDEGGGGGAGAIMVSNPFALSQRNYTVTIGDGGTSSGSGTGGTGGSTVFDTETATGGGGGGGSTSNGGNGANGGGGAAGLGGHSGASNGGTGTAPTFSTLTGTVHAGNDGGNGHQGSSTAPGGGGGGAGGDGVAPSGAGAAGGNGGVGISIASFPTTLYWGGGAGGGCHGASGGTGGAGSGGGGADSSTTGGLAGTAGLNAGGSGAGEVGGAGGVNTGAGGGGSGWNGSGSGGTGGKGYVVVRHLE